MDDGNAEVLFDGGEMALIGKIREGGDDGPIVAQVSAISKDGPIELTVISTFIL